MSLDVDLHGVPARVEVEEDLPGLDAGQLREELRRELSCYPESAARAPQLEVRVRPLSPHQPLENLQADPGWLQAHVTPEVWIRWRPVPAEAEVVLHTPACLDEVILATWARLVTGLRFGMDPEGPILASFHGASLAGAGGGLLLLGDSGAGKTTFSCLLTHLGRPPRLEYLGDEDALLAPGAARVELLALPRRLRLLHPPAGPEELPGRTFSGFGEEGWLADRPAARTSRAPLRGIVLLDPVRGADRPTRPTRPTLSPLPPDQLNFELLRGLERFPPDNAGTPEGAELFQAANRAGFELSGELSGSHPGYRLTYRQPEDFEAAAHLLAELADAP